MIFCRELLFQLSCEVIIIPLAPERLNLSFDEEIQIRLIMLRIEPSYEAQKMSLVRIQRILS